MLAELWEDNLRLTSRNAASSQYLWRIPRRRDHEPSRPRAFSTCGLMRPSGEHGSSMRLRGGRLDQTVERPTASTTASTINASQKDATEPRWIARVLAGPCLGEHSRILLTRTNLNSWAVSKPPARLTLPPHDPSALLDGCCIGYAVDAGSPRNTSSRRTPVGVRMKSLRSSSSVRSISEYLTPRAVSLSR
jgi:hypothetical protein